MPRPPSGLEVRYDGHSNSPAGSSRNPEFNGRIQVTQTGAPTKMNSRERVLTALQREQPDRTPCDFWAEPPALRRLMEHTGHADEEQLLQALKVDVRHLEACTPPDLQIADGLWQNFWGERFVQQATPWGPMRHDVKGALAGTRSFSDLECFNWPSPDCIDRSALAKQCHRHEQYALLYGFADVWQRPGLVRGWEEFFVDLVERPDWVHYVCRKFTEFYLEDYTRAAELTCGRIDLYLLISDLGTQRGPLISKAMFLQFVSPYLKQMIDRIHQLGGKVLFHSCGSIGPLIPELKKLGVDVLDPIQPAGEAMQPETLKQRHGEQLSFHGGIDMQHLLPHAKPAEVEAQVRRYCEVLGEGGGYIAGPAHLFQPDVPAENVLALYNAVK